MQESYFFNVFSDNEKFLWITVETERISQKKSRSVHIRIVDKVDNSVEGHRNRYV